MVILYGGVDEDRHDRHPGDKFGGDDLLVESLAVVSALAFTFISPYPSIVSRFVRLPKPLSVSSQRLNHEQVTITGVPRFPVLLTQSASYMLLVLACSWLPKDVPLVETGPQLDNPRHYQTHRARE